MIHDDYIKKSTQAATRRVL